jgi:hypothetical protein
MLISRFPTFLAAIATFGLAAPLCVIASPGQAKPAPARHAAKPAAKEKDAPAAKGTGQAIKLGQFDDWTAYATPGGRKVCYALSTPKERLPKNLNRDPGYLFVSYRPEEKVRGEIAIVMGYTVKEDAPAEAMIGQASFDLAGKDASLFVRNAAQESTMLGAMRKGSNLIVKASSKRGNQTTDKFSLSGISDALEAAEKACK